MLSGAGSGPVLVVHPHIQAGAAAVSRVELPYQRAATDTKRASSAKRATSKRATAALLRRRRSRDEYLPPGLHVHHSQGRMHHGIRTDPVLWLLGGRFWRLVMLLGPECSRRAQGLLREGLAIRTIWFG